MVKLKLKQYLFFKFFRNALQRNPIGSASASRPKFLFLRLSLTIWIHFGFPYLASAQPWIMMSIPDPILYSQVVTIKEHWEVQSYRIPAQARICPDMAQGRPRWEWKMDIFYRNSLEAVLAWGAWPLFLYFVWIYLYCRRLAPIGV
jgi:hypothetical protein